MARAPTHYSEILQTKQKNQVVTLPFLNTLYLTAAE